MLSRCTRYASGVFAWQTKPFLQCLFVILKHKVYLHPSFTFLLCKECHATSFVQVVWNWHLYIALSFNLCVHAWFQRICHVHLDEMWGATIKHQYLKRWGWHCTEKDDGMWLKAHKSGCWVYIFQGFSGFAPSSGLSNVSRIFYLLVYERECKFVGTG